jgi:outer membrane protein assembly factor BamB
MKSLRSAAGGPGSWLPAAGLLSMGLLVWLSGGPVAAGQREPGASALLAESPWPKYRRDALHTGRSPHAGPTSGRLKWTFSTGKRDAEGGIETDPVLGLDGTVYFGGKNGVLYAIRERRGLFSTGPEVVWAYRVGPGIQSSPLLAGDGTVYLGDEKGTLHSIRPPASGEWGAALWTFATQGNTLRGEYRGQDCRGTIEGGSFEVSR